MSTDLVPTNAAYTLAEITSIGEVFAKSGYFKDATDMAKAVTKVLAGQELGLGPMQSMVGIHVVQGKPTLSASLVGALIKRSGRYDYRVRSLDDKACTLDFYEKGEKVGDSTFTIDDAKAAGLLNNSTWKSYPRNMLHSRALTNGARWYCPDVFGGAIYTPDELGAVIDGESGEIISAPVEPAPATVPAATPPLFATPATVQEILELEAKLVAGGVLSGEQFAKALRKDYDVNDVSSLSPDQADELRARLATKLAAVKPPADQVNDGSQFAIPAAAQA